MKDKYNDVSVIILAEAALVYPKEQRVSLVRDQLILVFINREVVQLVECLVWDQVVVGSSPIFPTKQKRSSDYLLLMYKSV